MGRSNSTQRLRRPAPCTDLTTEGQLGFGRSAAWFMVFAVALIAIHAPLLRLPYFWDEAGYYIPAARDLLAGSVIPHSTPSNAHPPLVMAWLALNWKMLGQSAAVTRCAMLLLAAFSLLGFFRLARAVSNSTVAAASTFLVAVYPVFFAQSSLGQVDLPAAGLAFWGLEAYARRKRLAMATSFSLAALAKETAVLVPLALFLWELGVAVWAKRSGEAPLASMYPSGSSDQGRGLPLYRPQRRWSGSQASERLRAGLIKFRQLGWLGWAEHDASSVGSGVLLVPVFALVGWYAYHYARTGFVFGNPEFFRYNVQGTLHPWRIFLALLLRVWQVVGYLGLYVLTLACALAMKYPPLMDRWFSEHSAEHRRPAAENVIERPRIAISIQLAFLAIAVIYLFAMSVVGGAVLARYMLPIVPLFILISVSTIWRRLKPWPWVLGVVGLAFILAIFVNPPYGFSPEDNLAYRDYIRLHQHAEAFLQKRYPQARVLTAWPASDELSRPFLGYVKEPMQVVRIEDFTAEQLLSAADARSRFDVALVFSTKYHPESSIFHNWRAWQRWKSQYFGYHLDLSPEAAASVLGGEVIYNERRRGQWVAVIAIQKIEEAANPVMRQGSAMRWY